MSDALDVAGAVPPRSLLGSLPGPVWGIDPSTQRVSVAVIVPAPAARLETHTLSLRQGGEHAGVRLGRAGPELAEWFARLGGIPSRAAGWSGADVPALMPYALAVEEPFGGKGKKVPVESYMMCGQVLVAIFQAFGERPKVLKMPGSYFGVGPTSWKARAMGAGNGFADKPAIAAWAQRACGWPGVGPTTPQDEADALGIATWAAMEVVAHGERPLS